LREIGSSIAVGCDRHGDHDDHDDHDNHDNHDNHHRA
jgi:hypothetical protein